MLVNDGHYLETKIGELVNYHATRLYLDEQQSITGHIPEHNKSIVELGYQAHIDIVI